MSKITENPLARLTATWKGEMGIDIAPKPEIDENNPYYETLTIEPVDIEIENAEEQVVREKSKNKVSHSETGYWVWDKNTIMNSFSIPRGISVLAGGNLKLINNTLQLSDSLKEKDTK